MCCRRSQLTLNPQSDQGARALLFSHFTEGKTKVTRLTVLIRDKGGEVGLGLNQGCLTPEPSQAPLTPLKPLSLQGTWSHVWSFCTRMGQGRGHLDPLHGCQKAGAGGTWHCAQQRKWLGSLGRAGGQVGCYLKTIFQECKGSWWGRGANQDRTH